MKTKGDRKSLRRSLTFCGIALSAVLIYLGIPALASATGDALANYGSSTDNVPFSRVYEFSASCAALPCQIKITERATARGRHIAGLDKAAGSPTIMNEELPSAGPEPQCSEGELSEGLLSGSCPKKEAWAERQAHEPIYAVWFTRSELNGSLLNRTLKRYRAVVLHVTGTLTDAAGNHAVATRAITLRPVATLRRQEKREAEQEKRKEESPQGKIEHAEDEYCEKVLSGEIGGTFTAAGHIYTHCHVGLGSARHEVVVSEHAANGG
jgi:hypothetical protein